MAGVTKPDFRSRARDGVRVALRVTPKARKRGIPGAVDGVDGPRLRIAVSEPPEDGKAGRAACAVLADALGVAPNAVQLLAGGASREKLLLVAGDADTLVARLLALG